MAKSLSAQQIQSFLNDGLLVVDNVLTEDELLAACTGLKETLAAHGVDCDNLADSGLGLSRLSSTNGSGGVLDIFYDNWKLEIATNSVLFEMTTQLWEAAYCHQDEDFENLTESEQFKWHPFGPFDPKRGYSYIDRLGYRLPSNLSQEIGARLNENSSKKKSPLQRSLTPHLDCCPESMHDNRNKAKWRPIQCFVSLTDNLQPNSGGFEAVKGFHHEFADWAKRRPPTVVKRKGNTGLPEMVSFPAPCVGEYTHIRPKEDEWIMKRIQHIPVKAGGAVFWDNRLPHANAYRHNGAVPRAVVYCSFLPDVPINREYVKRQLEKWRKGQNPSDQWIVPAASEETLFPDDKRDLVTEDLAYLSQLAHHLLGAKPW